MAITPFPIERARPSKSPYMVWVQRDPDNARLYRVYWNDEGKSGVEPVDYAVPFRTAAHMAARIACERSRCVVVDAAVRRLMAREVRR